MQRESSAMLILVADDLDDTREAMKLLLQLHEHEVIEAVNGEQAVEMAARHNPDLILMDLNMPVMDGIAAVKQLRSQQATMRVPIFALSANSGGDAFVAQALTAGCEAYFPKPVDLDSLYAAILSVAPVTTQILTDPLHNAAVECTLGPSVQLSRGLCGMPIEATSPPLESAPPQALTSSSGERPEVPGALPAQPDLPPTA